MRDEASDEGRGLELRQVTDLGETVQPDMRRQGIAVLRRHDPVLFADDDPRGAAETVQRVAHGEELRASGKDAGGKASLARHHGGPLAARERGADQHARQARRLVDQKPEPVRVERDGLRRYLGKEKFFNEAAERTSVPGVATGLAWTPVGGDILFIECSRMPGSGRLEITGQLGFMPKTSLMSVGADVRLSLLEGFRRGLPAILPDVAVGGGVRTVTGTPQLQLTIAALDAQISKPLPIAESSVLTPWIGYQHLWIFANSGTIDFTPQTEAALDKLAAAGMNVVESTTPMKDWLGMQS